MKNVTHTDKSLKFSTSHLCTHIPKASVGLPKEPGGRAEARGRAGVGRVSKQTSGLGGSSVREQTLITKNKKTALR